MKNILIIDDESRIRDIIKIQLQAQPFIVLEAENEQQAFAVLASNTISLILCDVKLKELDGFTIVQKLKALEYKNIPVIMLTGFIDKETTEQANKIGCADFITKPVKRQKLIDCINKALNE